MWSQKETMETNFCYINVQSDGADTNIGIGTGIMTDGATMSQKQNKKRF